MAGEIMKYKIFLFWFLLISLISVASLVLYKLGVYGAIWEGDPTRISYIILTLFYFTSIWCGVKCWELSKINDPQLVTIEYICNRAERLCFWGQFISAQLVTLGLLGTIIGLMLSFSGFENIDVSNPIEMKRLIQQIAGGISTALITTICGIITALLLKLQYFILENEVRFIRNNHGKI